MPDHHHVKLTGTVTDIFGHRFVVATAKGKVLADIGPEGAEFVTLEVNDPVDIEGEQKPSEIKVQHIAVDGAAPIDLHHGPKHKAHPEPSGFNAEKARRIAEKEGFLVLGELRPHKKHFEAVAEHKGARHDIHVHEDHIMVRHNLK
jgi:hypothetical protein